MAATATFYSRVCLCACVFMNVHKNLCFICVLGLKLIEPLKIILKISKTVELYLHFINIKG